MRNPWDRLVSYLQEHHAERLGVVGISLAELIERLDRGDRDIRSLHSMRPQADFLTRPDGRLRIDFLGHFEHSGDDFAAVMSQLWCVAPAIGHENRSAHARQDYRPDFDVRLRRLVERHFADDIRHFDYVFEQAAPVRRISGSLDRPR